MTTPQIPTGWHRDPDLTHPACALCKGACCESILVNSLPVDQDNTEFYRARGFNVTGDYAWIETRCPQLDACGKCAIFATRPKQCVAYPVGGAACRITVKHRRPDQAEAILALLPVIKPAQKWVKDMMDDQRRQFKQQAQDKMERDAQ